MASSSESRVLGVVFFFSTHFVVVFVWGELLEPVCWFVILSVELARRCYFRRMPSRILFILFRLGNRIQISKSSNRNSSLSGFSICRLTVFSLSSAANGCHWTGKRFLKGNSFQNGLCNWRIFFFSVVELDLNERWFKSSLKHKVGVEI